jgi:hypothetical protein
MAVPGKSLARTGQQAMHEAVSKGEDERSMEFKEFLARLEARSQSVKIQKEAQLDYELAAVVNTI